MTNKEREIKEHMNFHQHRIDELITRLESLESFDARKACINEMVWRCGELSRLDTLNKKRLLYKLENFTKKLGI